MQQGFLERLIISSLSFQSLIVRSINATLDTDYTWEAIEEFQSLIVRSINATIFLVFITVGAYLFQSLIVRSINAT